MNLWWYLSCRVTTSLIFLKMVSFWLRMFMGTCRLDSIWFNWWEMNVFISLTNSSSPLMRPLTSWLGRHSDMTDKLLVLCICACKCIMTNWADYLTLFKTLKYPHDKQTYLKTFLYSSTVEPIPSRPSWGVLTWGNVSYWNYPFIKKVLRIWG